MINWNLLIFVDTISCLIPPKCITNNNNHHFSTSFNLHISKLSQKNSSVHFTNAMSLTMHSQNSQECTGIVCNYELYTCFSAEMTLGAHHRINRKTLQYLDLSILWTFSKFSNMLALDYNNSLFISPIIF